MKIKDSLVYAANKLRQVNIKLPDLEARILAQHVTSKSVEYLLARSETMLTQQQQLTFEQLLNRRILLEPIAYIIGYKEFYGYQFIIDNRVLIPRQDTEIIIDAILSDIDQNRELTILELGTGSGCIALTLLLSLSNLEIIATDISNEAIAVAKQNAIKHQVIDRFTIVNSWWFNNLEYKLFDVIVSNPPYISLEDIAHMSYETIKYEPHLALFADNNGLAAYYTIAKQAKKFLKQGGQLFLEIGFNQLAAVTAIFTMNHYVIKKIYQDLEKRDRVISIVNG